MSGRPTKLLIWLQGIDPKPRKPVPTPGSQVGAADIRGYLGATDSFVENPQNFMHMIESVAVGMAQLTGGASPIAAAPTQVSAAAAPTEDCFVCQQANGRMFLMEAARAN